MTLWLLVKAFYSLVQFLPLDVLPWVRSFGKKILNFKEFVIDGGNSTCTVAWMHFDGIKCYLNYSHLNNYVMLLLLFLFDFLILIFL